MLEDYEYLQQGSRLSIMLSSIEALSSAVNLRKDSPELAILSNEHMVSVDTLLIIPTISKEGILDAIKDALRNVLDFIKNLYSKLVKFVKKIVKMIFGKSDITSVTGEAEIIAKYKLDMEAIKKSTENKMYEYLDANKLNADYAKITDEERTLLETLYPEDDIISKHYDIALDRSDKLLKPDLTFLLKNNYTVMTSLIEHMVSSIKSRDYTLSLVDKNTRIYSISEVGLDYKEVSSPKRTMIEDATTVDNFQTATLTDAKNYIESELIGELSKVLKAMVETDIVDDNIEDVRNLFTILNLIQTHMNSIVIIFNKHHMFLTSHFTVIKHIMTIEEIRREK